MPGGHDRGTYAYYRFTSTPVTNFIDAVAKLNEHLAAKYGAVQGKTMASVDGRPLYETPTSNPATPD